LRWWVRFREQRWVNSRERQGTNYRTNGLYLPADDRRHYVAWSEAQKEEFEAEYWSRLYAWFDAEGSGHVAAYLSALDLSGWDPKAPPPKTPAFWMMADNARAPESAGLADALERLGWPEATTIEHVCSRAGTETDEFLRDRRNRTRLPYLFESCAYFAEPNHFRKDHLWSINGRRQVIYVNHEKLKDTQDRQKAARAFEKGHV